MTKLPANQPSPQFSFDSARRFAVIGAGAAGLAHAKYLREVGFEDVTIYEMGSNIGGLWCFGNDNGRSAAYRTLHINTAKNITSYSDHPFGPDVQMFPDHADMKAYLDSYVDRFDLEKLIRFNQKVTEVRPAPDYTPEEPKWEVATAAGETETYDRVIIATGHLSEPSHVPQFRSFAGEYLHSHDYRAPEPFVGKKICVVGIGNSAIDIASDVCVNSKRTVLVARSGAVIMPKMMFGVPFTDITLALFRPWIPGFVREGIISVLVRLIHGNPSKFGFPPSTKRLHTTSSAVLMSHIAYSRIGVKNGIERIEGRRIHFSDGTSDEFDVLVGATGYLIDLPFVSDDIVAVKDNWIDLYRRIVPPGWYGIYFAGFINPTISLNLTFEYQARWVCAIEAGLMQLPKPSEMHQVIEAKKDWTRKVYKDSARHTMEEDHPIYFKEMKIPNWKRLFKNPLPR